MAETFKCRSMLLCDEVREEVGGKHLIIGAYAGVILIPFVPFFATRLSMRFEISVDRPHFDHASCTVLRPNKSIFYHWDMPFDTRYPEFPTSIIFYLSGLNFEHTGMYTVLLAMDSPPETVGDFFIVTPEEVPQKS
jgi:hypothetical protein